MCDENKMSFVYRSVRNMEHDTAAAMPGFTQCMSFCDLIHGEYFSNLRFEFPGLDQGSHFVENMLKVLREHYAGAAYTQLLGCFLSWESNRAYENAAGFESLPRSFHDISADRIVDHVYILYDILEVCLVIVNHLIRTYGTDKFGILDGGCGNHMRSF